MKEVEIKVKGLMCTGCENRVKAALSTYEFVENVEVDHKTGTVKVNVVDNENINRVIETIADLGFEVAKED